MKDTKRLTLTHQELLTLRGWLKIIQLEEPSQGAWIRDGTEFFFMVKLKKRIADMIREPRGET